MPVDPPHECRPIVVLDTNATLDWLVFCDIRATALAEAVTAGFVDWIACPSMRTELERALSYSAVRRHAKAPLADALRRFDALARITTEPNAAATRRPQCLDPDDQVFVDLALEHGAVWLLSNDKMVRMLAPRVAALGLWIGPPAAFSRGTCVTPLRP